LKFTVFLKYGFDGYFYYNTYIFTITTWAWPFGGRYDYLVPTKPVVDYYKILKAPYKKIIWFEESARRMDIEEPEKFQNTIMEIAEKQDKE
jgi:hypothetical protein